MTNEKIDNHASPASPSQNYAWASRLDAFAINSHPSWSSERPMFYLPASAGPHRHPTHACTLSCEPRRERSGWATWSRNAPTSASGWRVAATTENHLQPKKRADVAKCSTAIGMSPPKPYKSPKRMKRPNLLLL